MAINISAWSIRHPLPAMVMFAAIVAMGFLTFSKLPITQLPNADIPVVSVTITQFGAAPAELETQVTKTVEDAVSGVEGVNHITSLISDGMSTTTITFRLETNTDRALNDIKDAVNYRTITKQTIRLVERSSFLLVERLAHEIASICLADPRVERARVRVEKPGALRFARSVGVEIGRGRE